MKNSAVLILFIFFSVTLPAQNIQSWIDAKKPLLFEKLYVHVDREFYSPGDTIWMKVYQVNGITHKLNANFRNVFVQLVSEEGKVVKDLMLFSVHGQATGEFKTASLQNGMYTIRAYTKYLKNFGEDAFFYKKIRVTKSRNPAVDLTNKEQIDLAAKAQTERPKIDVAFLPEGGDLVLNAVNTVAFKAINSKGKGIFVRGKIRNENGDTITSFVTSYLGMGKFNLMPEDGKTYYATIDQNPELKIPLPLAKENGICLNYFEKEESLMCTISANMKGNKYPVFYLVASHKGSVLFNQKVEMTDFSQVVRLSRNLFPDGISKITLLDTITNPLAERLIFVNNHKADLLSFRMNRNEFKSREEVKIDVDALLEPGDSITSTLSVAVVNRNYFSTGQNSQNIKSYLLLDSDLKGAIESPASFFSSDEFHTSTEKLDLLMLVHGWRTYLWDDIEKIKTPSFNDWNDAGITISGSVKKLLWNAPAPEAEIFLDYVNRKFRVGQTTSNLNGRFYFERIYLLEKYGVMLNARTRNGTANAEIMLDPLPKLDSVINASRLESNCFDLDWNPDFLNANTSRLNKEMEYNPENGSILLEGVNVVKKRSTLSRSFGEYPWTDKTFNITMGDYSFYNVIDYLVDKVTSFTNSGDGVMMKHKPVKFKVDGMDFDLRDVLTIHMNDIESIDLLDPITYANFTFGTLGASNGAGLIAIYRKDVPDIRQSDAYVKGRIVPKINGFYRSVEFYSPKYTIENISSPKPDFRPTLFWNPELNLENGKASLDFFTSDEPGQYVVFVEGISKNGKICFGTTGFSVNKK